MVVTVSIDRIEQRARSALGHKDLAWIMANVPREYRDNPAVIRSFLVTAAEGWQEFADSAVYHSAHSALAELQQTRDLRDQVAAIYWDPKIRAEFGEARVEAAFRDPATAYHELIQQSAAGGLSPHLDKALDVIGEVRQFASEHGIAEPVPAEVPLPNDVGKAEAEIKSLVGKSVSGRLSAAEDARLTKLYEARIAREDTGAAAEIAAHAKSLGMRDRPAGEFERLIGKSVGGKLSPAENDRLDQLSGARAVEQGLVTQDDLDAETE
jgi:hypothetical protein